MQDWRVETASPEETRELARLLGEIVVPGAVILLQGELGAGKTCFAQGLARGLGVSEEHPVTSPTFVIMNQYPGRLRLDHFDLYRLSGAEDLEDVGLTDIVGQDGVSLVEWPDQCQLDVPSIRVAFSGICADSRVLEISADDDFHQQLATKWRQIFEDHR